MAFIMALSIFILLVFVKRNQIRIAVFAFLLSQLFSWLLTILYVQFGLLTNPVRLFPHATESNFLFAFIFHPSVFVVYFFHYPYKSKKRIRILYTASLSVLPIMTPLLASLMTELVAFKYPLFAVGTYFLTVFLFSISRLYIDWFYKTYLLKRL
jgi:hypothetical protein